MTPLLLSGDHSLPSAAQYGSEFLLSFMPLQTRSVELTNRNDPTLEPFLEACRQGDLSRVQAQVEHRDRKDGSLTHGLRAAAKADHVETMRCLLEHGAIIDQSVVFATRSPAGFQVLIDHGFGVNDPMGWGYSPLMPVVEKNDEELLRWFLAQGADPNLGPADKTDTEDDPIQGGNLPVPNSGGPLEVAAQCCSMKIVDILLDHGAKIENSLVHHRAALRRTSESIPMMEYLVRCGADVNKRGAFAVVLQHGGTPLHVVARVGDVEAAQWLLDHGADPTITDAYGMLPAHWAEIDENEDVRQLLFNWCEKKSGSRVGWSWRFWNQLKPVHFFSSI